MTSQERNEFIEVLTQLQDRYPDWRFGQLISNVAGWADREIWDVEDEELLAAAKQHLNALSQRKEEARS